MTTFSSSVLAPRRLAVGLVAVSAMSLAACGGGSDPLNNQSAGGGASSSAAAGTVTVGSADFSESKLLAQIYTGALKAKGVQVNAPRLGIGAREAYLKGMTDGSINVIPEYTGALAIFYDKSYTGSDPNEVYKHVEQVLPQDLKVLQPSQAENKDSITVTRQTADSQGLRTISDLTDKAANKSIGGPAEFKSRPQGLPGIKQTYGITFGTVRELGGQALVQALVNGQVDAANIYTTDPAFAQYGLVALKDDKGHFGSQNIVPLVTGEVAQSSKATEALNGVSKALTTQDLQQMLTKVDVQKQDVDTVAQEFLKSKNLG